MLLCCQFCELNNNNFDSLIILLLLSKHGCKKERKKACEIHKNSDKI